MKKILIILSIMFCSVAFAHTIEWYVGDNLLSITTCESGDNITPPTIPEKFGYHFKKWKPEYTRIEYLESTGTQYIDTGIIQSEYKQDLIVEIDLQFTDMTTYTKSFSSGCAGGGTYFIPLSLLSNGYWSSNIGIGDIEFPGGDLNKHHVICDSVTSKLTIDNNTYNYPNNGANINKSILLFSINGSSSILSGKLKIYGAKFTTDDHVVLRNFIPVLDDEGIPCMYDKVEKKFYYNQGTGDFIAGPVLTE